MLCKAKPAATHHSLHTVRQQHHQAALSDPFALSGGDELIDNALSCVVEVPELRLPADQRVRVGHREAKFESQHSILRQRRIAHRVGRLVRVEVRQNIVFRLVHLSMKPVNG